MMSPEVEKQISKDLEENPRLRRFDYLNEFGNENVVLVPKRHCLFCDHCTDYFCDFLNGPYAFICDTDAGDGEAAERGEGECPEFKEEQ